MSRKILRRFHSYDCARGGSMFVTVTLAERKPLFGRVMRERAEPSEAGKIAQRDLPKAANHFYDFITLRSYEIVPDYVHMRFTCRRGMLTPCTI